MNKAQYLIALTEEIWDYEDTDEGAAAKLATAGAVGGGLYYAGKKVAAAGAKHLDTIEKKRRRAMEMIGKD